MSSAYERLQQRKQNNTTKVPSDKKTSSSAFERLQQRKKKKEYNDTIKFDTLESDINTLSANIQKVYDGWQTEETLNNTRSSIEAMQKRVSAYQNWQKEYGDGKGADLTELSNNYKSMLENFDELYDTYGKYDSADAYKKAIKEADEAAKIHESKKTADLNVVQKEIDDLQKILDTANSKRTTGNTQPSNAVGIGYVEDRNTAKKQLDNYLKSVGYSSIEDIEKALDDKKFYLDDAKAIQEKIQLDAKEKKMETSEVGKKGFQKFLDDTAKAEVEKKAEEENLAWWEKAVIAIGGNYGAEPGQIVAQVINDKRKDNSYALPKEDWNDKERNVFGDYYWNEGIEAAMDYGARLNNAKAKEKENKSKSEISNSATSGFWAGAGHTLGAIITAPLGLADYLDDLTDKAAGRNVIVEEADITPFEYSQTVTGAISTDLNEKSGTLPDSIPIIGGKGLGDVYGLGTSILQSTASAYTLGGVGTLVSYFGQGAAANVDDALSRGATSEQALLYGTILGAAEGVSEMIGVDKLLKIGSPKDLLKLFKNSKKGFWQAVNKQGWAEGLEEGFSGVAGKVADNFVMGDKSQFNQTVKELRNQGISLDEAKKKAWVQSVSDIAYDVLGGYVSGGIHAAPHLGVQMAKSNHQNKKTGANIRGNNQISGMLDIASLSQEETDAYNLYTHYANKGVNAENISDLQLGRLHQMAGADAQSVLSSKKSTTEEIENAKNTLNDLAAFNQNNSAQNMGKKNINALYGDKEGTSALIEEGLESGENTESYKLATELKAKMDKGEKITTDELAKLADANTSAYKGEIKTDAEARLTELGETNASELSEIIVKKSNGEILTNAEKETLQKNKNATKVYNEINNEDLVANTENMSEGEANLILSTYDDSISVDSFMNSYNLVKSYATNRFSNDYVLEHRGKLTPTQVSAIYSHFVTDKDAKTQKMFDDLKVKHKNAPFQFGAFNDSVIDYNNSGAEGKVNWNDLNDDQKNAITIVGTIAQQSGLDVELIIDGYERGINGAFEISGNKILIDVYAGMDKVIGSKWDNFILPTLSHEMTHWMEEKAPEFYRKYSDYVMQTLVQSTNKTEDKILDARRRLLEKKHPGQKFLDDYVRREVIARASEDMLGKSEIIKGFLDTLPNAEKKTFVEKVKEILQKLKDWFNSYLAKNSSKAAEAKVIREAVNRIDGQIELWDAMLKSAIETNQALKNEGIKAQKNTTEGDVQFEDREHYWRSGFSHNEMSYVERIAKYEVETTDNYIDNGSKWLYNNRKDKPYFALYSTSHIDNPTVMYASKGSQATKEYKWFMRFIETLRSVDNGEYEQSTRVLSKVLENFWNDYGTNNRDSRNALGRRSNIRDVKTNNPKTDFKPSEALFNCLRNITEKQKQEKVTQNSDRDSLGNTLTEAQQSYFAESKVRDENGNLKVMYHGTPNATFTKFRSGTYFTEHKWYADNYQNQGASSLSYKNTADNPDTYAVYLDIKKPFDTRNKAERDIFYKEYYQQWGTGTDLMESGLPDWLDGQDLQEFLEEKGYDYDGLILDEGATGGYGEEVVSRGLSYVIFDPAQVKNIDNLNPTSDPDIRFSDRDTEYMQAIDNGDADTLERFVEDAAEKAMPNSKVRDADGKLLKVYHGRVSDFNVFDRSFGNVTGDFGKGFYFTSNEYDVDENYANEEGPDLKNKIERYAEKIEFEEEYEDLSYEERKRIARLHFITSEPNTITAYLNMENPVYITPNEKGTFLDFIEEYDEEYDEYGEPEGLLVDFIEALRNRAMDFDTFGDVNFDFLYEEAYDYGGEYAANVVRKIKNRIIDEITDENGDVAVNEVIRLAFEDIGFDGIIDTSVYYKFRNMNGMDSGTTHYIVFNSNQIKYADLVTYDNDGNVIPLSKRFNENEVDIRYSDRDEVNLYDLMGENQRLIKENENFKADVERLKERLKIERQVTHGNYFNENQINAVAGHLRKIANTTYDKVELMKQLKDLYSYIAHAEELSWEDVFSKAYAMAKNMLTERKEEVFIDDYFKEMLKDIRSQRISLNDKQKQTAEYTFGKDYHKFLFGKFNIAKDGLPLDIAWQQWANKYGRFDTETTDADQIIELYNIYEEAKQGAEVVAEYNEEETARWLANEIYNQYWNVSPIRTTADKYDKQIKRLNAEHRNAMRELRDNYDNRLAEQKKAGREKYQKLAQEIRERKDKEIAEVKKLGQERMAKYKENAERKTKIQSITSNSLTLNKWLTTNSKDYHIHENMKTPVIALLNAIDFSSKRRLDKNYPTQNDIYLSKALSKVKDMMVDATNLKEGLEELYGHDMDEELAALVDSVDNIALTVGNNEYVLNRMSLEELQTLDKLVKTIKHTVTKLNTFHTVHHNRGAVNLANEFMEYGDKLGKLKKQDGRMGKFFKFRNCTPYYFFKRLGEAGVKVFEAFQDGWDKLAFNSKQIIDFTEKTYTNKEVQEWTKQTKTFTLKQPDGSNRTFEMSISQIMALHCISKQEDAQRHLLTSGMTLSRVDKKGKVIADYENISLSSIDLTNILSTLTDRQKEVADKLQEFMNTVCSDWGNEISMARFAVKMFGLPNYFPIKVSPTTIPTDNTKEFDNASLFRLLNMSFTKSRNEYANQSIEIGDVFDIFAQHTTDMAKYNAMALPVLDFNKFYSIKGKAEGNKEVGVDSTLRNVFGNEAVSYVKRFVRDINGSQNVSRDVLGKTFFKNAKVAAVAANLRVVLLQPTAFFKASAVLDNKYLLKAGAYMKVNPISMKGKFEKAIANAEKYCGIIQWKALGYYDTDISKGIAEKIKHAETFKDKAIEKSLKGAELADKLTFGTLWVACDFEIRDTRKDLKVGSEEFYQAVAKRLREVIYATQVVDSTMTRTDMMRSSDTFDKMLTTFGSEPAIAYNMLMDMAMQFGQDKKTLGKKEAWKKNGKKIRKVIASYVLVNAVAALVESGFDVYRDDDDEEDELEQFMGAYLKNFALDMSIGNKLPIVKELYTIMQGYSSSRMDTQWAVNLVSGANTWLKIFSGEGEGKGDKAIKDILKAFSNLSGFAFYNLYRDLMATLYNLGILDKEDIENLFS